MFMTVSDRALQVTLCLVDYARTLARDSHIRMMVGYARDLVGLVRAIEARAATSLAAASLQIFEPGLAQFANDHGLNMSRTPLRVDGEMPGLELHIWAPRVDKGQYQLSARLRPANKALKGVTLARTRDVGPDWVEVEGDDVDFGDPKLNEAYQARSMNPKGATLLASPLVREWLGQMLDRDLSPLIRHGKVELTGVEPDPQRPEQMANLGEVLLALASALSAAPTSIYR
jgi:hypothetical protein